MSPVQIVPPVSTCDSTRARESAQHQAHGNQKVQKHTSSNAARAWTEEAEEYLLRTRLRKTPYKQIAAHLNKTELACRLHHYQLLHNNNRRKQAVMLVKSPSPDYGSYQMSSAGSRSHGDPCQMTSTHSRCRSLSGELSTDAFETRLPRHLIDSTTPPTDQRSASPLPASLCPTQTDSLPQRPTAPPYESHCSLLPPVRLPSPPSLHGRPYTDSGGATAASTPPPPPPPPGTSVHGPWHVDLSRLHSIYASQSDSFWAFIAKDYGAGMPPHILERAWKTGMCCALTFVGGQAVARPMTPADSPQQESREACRKHLSRTSISSLLEH